MAKTPFIDLGSENILSAHLSGIQHAVSKVEDILNLKTEAVTAHALVAVADQSDVTLHHYIYEGTVRNWLADPVPTIYRGGVLVSNTEYDIQPAYGVIVFKVQQDPTDVITANFTRVLGQSVVIENLNSALSAVQGDVTALTGRVATLEGGGGGDISYSSGGGVFVDGKAVVTTPAVWKTSSTQADGSLTFTNDIGALANSMDAFPIYLAERTIIDKVKVEVTKQGFPTAKGMVGIYSTANGLPHKRLAQTAAYAEPIAIHEQAFTVGDLALEAGVYWLVRFSNAGTQYKALNSAHTTKLVVPADFKKDVRSPETEAGALRVAWANDATMPATFPLVGVSALGRGQYTVPMYHIKKIY